MERITFTVDGQPIPKGRPRMTKTGHTYTPERTRAWEDTVAWAARAAFGGQIEFVGDVVLTLHFRRKDKRDADVDNLVKAVKDALNGIAYADDKQVIRLIATKKLGSDNPGVDVDIQTAKLYDSTQHAPVLTAPGDHAADEKARLAKLFNQTVIEDNIVNITRRDGLIYAWLNYDTPAFDYRTGHMVHRAKIDHTGNAVMHASDESAARPYIAFTELEPDVPTLKIDPDLRGIIPPLGDNERQQLEASILTEGVRDKLIVWDGTLVDGHNRYDICHKHGITFQYDERDFDDKQAAMLWMIRNQLGRRNLNDAARIRMVKHYESIVAEESKKRQVANLKQGDKSPVVADFPQRESEGKTRDKLGELAGTSGKTYEAGAFVIDNAPQWVNDRWNANEITTYRANRLAKVLDGVNPRVVNAAEHYADNNVEKIDILKRLYKSSLVESSNDTFSEIERTGGFAYGEDQSKRVDFANDGVEAIHKGLKALSHDHAVINGQADPRTFMATGVVGSDGAILLKEAHNLPAGTEVKLKVTIVQPQEKAA